MPVEVVRVPHTYVAGEESALVRAIDGGPALPTAKPPRPFEEGVGGAPTLVQNVETLAHIALLARDPGAGDTFLATLTGGEFAPSLVEVPFGAPLGELVPAGLRGVTAGGLFGGLLADPWLSRSTTKRSVRPAAGWAAARSCCSAPTTVRSTQPRTPSRISPLRAPGSAASASTRPPGWPACSPGCALGATTSDEVARMAGWTQKVPGRGACALVDAAARMAASLLREFPDEVAAHLAHPCPRCAALGALPRHTRNHLEMS